MENRPIKILAIDDNQDNLISIKALLKESCPNVSVFTAQTGEKGLQLAISEDPDVILLDIFMPIMDGFEVCRKLKANRKLSEIPVVFVTAAKENKENRILALECGAEAFLAKPIDISELTAQIRAMLKIKAANIQKRDEKIRLAKLVEEKTYELHKAHWTTLNLLEDLKRENEARKESERSLLESEKALVNSHKLMSYIIEHSRSSVAVHDRDLKYLYVSQRYLHDFNIEGKDIIGKHHYEIFPNLPQKWRDVHEKALRGQVSSSEDDVYIHADGSEVWTRWECRPWYEADGSIGGIILYSEVITERKKAEIELRKTKEYLENLSYHDQLTGLYNRRFFEEELERLDEKRNLPLTIVIGDINGLKLINDSFGHAIGDELLKKAGEIIKKGCRADDIIARHGGDEFVIILPKTNMLEAMQVVDRIKNLASREKVASVELSISFGYDVKEKEEQTLSEILANAENQMYRHKIYERSSMRSKTIDIIMNTLFEKSNRELLHSKRVSQICQAIASKMNLEKDDISQIRIAGLVHDIGKIGIDEKILNKAATLNNDERKEIEKHPETGWRILSSTNEFSVLAQFILEHHEKWDGSGYPKGLKGEEISLEARIITVADSYDAMTNERSYRKGISKEEAIDEIKKRSGSHFDPEIAKLFIEMVLGKEF